MTSKQVSNWGCPAMRNDVLGKAMPPQLLPLTTMPVANARFLENHCGMTERLGRNKRPSAIPILSSHQHTSIDFK